MMSLARYVPTYTELVKIVHSDRIGEPYTYRKAKQKEFGLGEIYVCVWIITADLVADSKRNKHQQKTSLATLSRPQIDP
jgi:hypothetical protein